MKVQTFAIASLCACSLLAAAADAATVKDTNTATDTAAPANTASASTAGKNNSNANPYQSPADAAVSPEDGDYTYVEYEGVLVPCYKRHFYYIDGVWVWRGPGKPPFPPPKFRPVLPPRPPKAAPAKPVPPKKAVSPKKAAKRASKAARRAGLPRPPR